MDGAGNADSDQSLTWEDFFGSTTDLTPTLIGIYDSLLEPPLLPVNPSTFPDTKDNTQPPKRDEAKRKMALPISNSPSKDPRLIAGGVKLPGFSKEESPPQVIQPQQTVNRESNSTKMSYVSRFKSFALRKNNSNDSQDESAQSEDTSSSCGANKLSQSRLSEKLVEEEISVTKVKSCTNDRVNVISKLNSEVIAKVESNRKHWLEKSGNSSNSFDNLSPNVKRMLSSAGAENPCPKTSIVQPKKQSGLATVGRSSYRSRQSNIPLMGATSKITQSGVDIVSTADIYDRPSELTASLTRINVRSNHSSNSSSSPNGPFVSPIKSGLMNRVTNEWSSASNVSSFSPEKKQPKAACSDVEDGSGSIYDVPLNSSSIYDVPTSNKKADHTDSTREDCKATSKRNLLDIDRKDSMETDANDFVMIDSTEKPNHDFVMIDSPDKLANIKTDEQSKIKPEDISPSKPAALNIALAIRNLGETCDQNRSDTNARHAQVFEANQIPEVPCPPNSSMLYSQGCGSIGNLKSPEQDGRSNLSNVPRPLSMSSIASSSSTSSSGAQNKGVNSAYLASIESLDDHSDVDSSVVFAKNARLVQATEAMMARDAKDGGIAESVTPIQRSLTPPRPRYCDPSLSLLQRVCTEIVDTEGIYVEDLRQVVEGYLYPWRESGTFSPDDLDHLFSNIEDIYHFNRTFSEQLEQCNLEPISIARCFVLHSEGFRIYSRYCTGYPNTMAALARLAREPEASQQLRARQAGLGHPLPLGSYLLKPVQRILKYHLLLQNLVKQCMSHETEYALHKMTGIAQHINDMKKRHEHTVRVQEIQSLLYGWHGQDLTTYGELCAEGTFRVFGAKAMRHAFLFDKMLLLTKNKEYGILAYKSHIMCNNLMLVESIQGQPLSFHVIPFDCPRMQVTLQARNVQHKREWTLLLKRVILENYNAVIPSHARQLVMELGQNKTDDDMLAEKSSTLISHSSMRKQLSAPEYLEKRKLERERRKSFESGLRHRLKRSARKGQNADGTSSNNGLDKDKSLRNDSAFDEDICDCHNTCTNVDCSNYELCKDCQNGYVCSDCKSDSIYLCKSCQVDKDRLNYSDSIYDCDEDDRVKCSRCDASEFQSQTDVSYGNKKLKCLDCDKSIHYIDDQDIRENCSEGRVCVKCSSQKNPFIERENFKCSMEEMARKNGSCERCPSCNGKGVKVSEFNKKHYEMLDAGDDRLKIRESINLNLKKTCLKCQEIRENITMEDSLNYSSEAIGQNYKCEHDPSDSNLKRVSKDDSIALLAVPKPAGTLRRKSEPGMSNINFDPKDWKKSVENEMSKCAKSQEELVTKDKSFEGRCLDCGRITVICSSCGRGTTVRKNFKCKHRSIQEIDSLKSGIERKCRSLDRDANPLEKKQDVKCNTLEVKMYNSKTVPKKISKIKKNRAKTLRHLAVDSTAKFYTDFTTDNVLHISESTDSINTLNSQKIDIETKVKECTDKTVEGDSSQIVDVDDDLYRSLIQKTDSFKQSEIDKDKILIKKDTESSSEVSEKKPRSGSNSPKKSDVEDDAFESCDDGHERPLEQIISQLLMQNREFQKILKRHQLRNATNRRHQRLLKSHSNPEKVMAQNRETPVKIRPKYGRQTSAVESLMQNTGNEDVLDKENEQIEIDNNATELETIAIQQENLIKREDNVRLKPDKLLLEEHIYETLIVSPDKKYSKRDPGTLGSNNKTTSDDIPCLSTFAPLSPSKNDSNNKVIEAPNDSQKKDLPLGKQTRVSLSESDYVYLCFDGNKNIDAYRIPSNIKKVDEFEDNGEYAVPTPSPQKVQKDEVERRLVRDKVTLESEIKEKEDLENHYDNGSEVWKRISNDTVIENPAIKNRRNKDNLNNVNIDDYLESENGPQSPNIPEIWLKSQKEHFTTPRDKKSGSLPRSFQVNLNELEEKTSPMMKNKTTVYNKVYLNKDGKVLQTDRPFTIASDYSEISYEDIERFIKGDDNSALKFPCDLTISNRSSRSFVEGDSIDEAIDCVSRSTLELEAEIDRCYKNNFEMRREQLKNLNSSNNNLLLSAQLMDQSISSSMEVMNDKTQNNSQEDIPTSVHPEHKIYKTTANVLSLKSVLNRFKLKSRSNQEQTATTNANVEKEKDAKKIDGKKISTPKHNSRNLMQRFKSIINDEQHESNIAEALNFSSKEILNDGCKGNEKSKNGERKNWKGENILQKSLTVIVTQPDEPSDKNIVISKSFCEAPNQNNTTVPLEYVSRSCNNINKSTDSLVANAQQMSQSVQFSAQLNQGIKSAQSSVQDLNKLPIYKQGSRHLGARIAQSDYADPKALFLGDSNSDLDKVNIFINKNALRPDSLLSNSSHFTSSSEGYANANIEVSKNNSFLYRDSINFTPLTIDKKVEHSDTVKLTPAKIETDSRKDENNKNESSCTKFHFKIHSDESFYEKSFEEIENLFGNEIFRDSAIYSDPEDNVCYGFEKKPSECFTKTSITKRSCFTNATSIMKEKIDKLGVKNVTEEISKSVGEQLERRSCEMPVITSTSYLSTIEHVTNSTVISEVMHPPSIQDEMKDLESSSNANSEISNTLTSQKFFNPSKYTTSKPAPPVPTKPLFKSNLLHGIKSPAVIKIVEPPIKSTPEEIPILRYTAKNKDKNLNNNFKITENNPTDKGTIIKTESDASSDSDTTHHQVQGKLNIMLKSPEKQANVFQFPSPKSPTEKFKLGIPRPSCERATSSNIQIKRMSFERCSLDSASINRRSKSVTTYETDSKNTTEEKLITKSVQERKKEIELMTLNEQKQKNNSVINRKSVDGSEHSIMAFNRSVSIKMPTLNISTKDQSKYNANINNSIPIFKVSTQKCNIPVAGTSSGPKSRFFDDSCKYDVSVSLNSDENNLNLKLENATTGSINLSATNYKNEIVASGENCHGDNDTKDENSKGGWVKQVVNRFQ